MATIDYSYTLTETDEWFGFGTPYVMITILALYLLIVLKVGPAYMKNKEPYNLKTFMTVYNITQVIACIYVVQEIIAITSTRLVTDWACKYFDSNTLKEHKYNRIAYFTFWLKIVELSETVVFVLRKKQNQVSYLHVFHHCSTPTLLYLLGNKQTGGTALFAVLLNSIIHIIMYSYYFAAAVCDKKIMQRLNPVKKSITILQMVQFTFILIHLIFISNTCSLGVPMGIKLYYGIVVAVMFYGFYDFYKKTYSQRRLKKAA